ncbi:ATP-binding protein [Acidovorax sp. CCYZU-2555]|uniref:hybrid sensor histidine kinase/response regulator n=1 Tax=Acidovorax sp. CCYZU-2555 TaxID=2835042 RepID=UPI001BCC407A|nr:ATP-binding protein [Acidovorax sp. CCYZU-2555]MBS7781049.1 response regulator [Acidovorax sp. CCYZU-2555]
MVIQSPDQALHILHIEDSPADQGLARIILRRAGLDCRIQTVETLDALQQALQSQVFDLILADYHLPGFTALDAWALVAPLAQRPPFVLLSGAIGEAAAVDVMRLGMTDFLRKEDIARLPQVLTRAMEVHEARRAKKQAMAELALSQQRLAELTDHLQSSIEEERASIAREIHDDIGGSLTSVKFDLAWITRNTPADQPLHAHALSALEMLQLALGASQRIMMNLRPPVLDQGLVAAVQWLAEGFERRTGVAVQMRTSSAQIAASPEIQLVAYRCAQEAMTNIGKYAQASRVEIDLSDCEGFLTLEVTDNGCGMTAEQREKPRSFGLRGLQERARTVEGWLDVSSQPGRGTSIIVSIPLPSH